LPRDGARSKTPSAFGGPAGHSPPIGRAGDFLALELTLSITLAA